MAKKLTGFQIFKIYYAIFLHYTTDTYFYYENQGKTLYTEDMYRSRFSYKSFEGLVKEFGEWNPLQFEYYVSWLFYTRKNWVTPKNILEDQSRCMLEWTNYSRRRIENFSTDIIKIYSNDPNFIFDLLTLGEIHYSTLLILNRFTSIIHTMNLKLKGNPLWDHKYKKLIKFEPFYINHEPISDAGFKRYIPETLWPMVE